MGVALRRAFVAGAATAAGSRRGASFGGSNGKSGIQIGLNIQQLTIGNDKYLVPRRSPQHPIEERLPDRTPEVRRALWRKMAGVECHQIELAFVGHARETGAMPSRLSAFGETGHDKVGRAMTDMSRRGGRQGATPTSRSMSKTFCIKTGADVVSMILHVTVRRRSSAGSAATAERADDDHLLRRRAKARGRQRRPVGHRRARRPARGSRVRDEACR